MTVVVGVKVFEGFIVAADSATTIELPSGTHQVYNNANKIFHLHRTLPIAAATWGLGTIGSATIGTLAKDLRRRLMGKDPRHPGWALDVDTYTIRNVADRLIDLMFDEIYSPTVSAGLTSPGALGFLVAGYSAGTDKAEVWTVNIEDPASRPVPLLEAGGDQYGWGAYAIKEAAFRLFHGTDPMLESELKRVTDPSEHAEIDQVLASVDRPAVHPGMPYADAIQLAQFLADTTIGYVQFLLGPNVVGGPVEVAGISRHEGFKWVQRKHYYPSNLNPKEPNHDV